MSNTRPSAQRLDNEDSLTAWIVKGSNEAKSSDKHGTKSGGDELVDEGIIGLDKAASSSNPTEVISSSSAAKEDADKNHLAQVIVKLVFSFISLENVHGTKNMCNNGYSYSVVLY